MRFFKGLVVSVAIAGLAGCSGASSGSPSVGVTPTDVRTTASSVPPASSQVKAGAQAAATEFYRLYAASSFASSWKLLAPSAKRLISERAWVGVHEACLGAAAGKSRTIKAVTVFGSAAIVTEVISSMPPALGTTEDVFNLVSGHWRYSPEDLTTYRHKSVTADIAAAKASGACASWKIF